VARLVRVPSRHFQPSALPSSVVACYRPASSGGGAAAAGALVRGVLGVLAVPFNGRCEPALLARVQKLIYNQILIRSVAQRTPFLFFSAVRLFADCMMYVELCVVPGIC
jgi:hypothetical protein